MIQLISFLYKNYFSKFWSISLSILYYIVSKPIKIVFFFLEILFLKYNLLDTAAVKNCKQILYNKNTTTAEKS